MNRHLSLSFLLALPLTAEARTDTEQNPFALDISIERQHQEFAETSADLDTVALQTHMYVSNWDISIFMPWQHVKGEYFVNGFQPQATNLCQRYGGLTDAQIRFLQRRGRIDTGKIEDFCNGGEIGASSVDDESSGLSDISLAAHYGIAIDDEGLWLASFGAAYKWDNGDAETGLGSGTRETSLDAAIGADADHWRATLTTGYAFVRVSNSGEDLDQNLDDYAFYSLDAAWKCLHWLALGAAYQYEQSYVPDADDIRSASLYLEFRPASWIQLNIEARDYLNTEGFPDREYAASTTFLF